MRAFASHFNPKQISQPVVCVTTLEKETGQICSITTSVSGATTDLTDPTPYTRRVAETYMCGEAQTRLSMVNQPEMQTTVHVFESTRESLHPDLGEVPKETAAVKKEAEKENNVESLDADY